MSTPVITATAWRVGEQHEGWGDVQIVERAGPDVEARYAVVCLSDCANSDGKWEHEPLPTGRSAAFLARTRFDWETAATLAIKLYKATPRTPPPCPQ